MQHTKIFIKTFIKNRHQAKDIMAQKTKKKKAIKETKTQPITKDMPIGEVADKYPATIEVMFRHGMHCIGCHVAAFETVEQGAMAHGIDVDKFMKDLNEAAKKKTSKK
jgi:hybrid cluster-associated redox disulfide protein